MGILETILKNGFTITGSILMMLGAPGLLISGSIMRNRLNDLREREAQTSQGEKESTKLVSGASFESTSY